MTRIGAGIDGSRRVILLLALLSVAILFGGGGRSAPFASLTVQLVAIGCLAFALPEFRRFVASAPRLLAILVGITLLLPQIGRAHV